MLKISKKSATVLVVVICVGMVYGTKMFIKKSRSKVSGSSSSKVKGPDNAPIRITEFIDFQCPACAKGAQYLREMMEKYPQAIQLEVKHYPLLMHRHGYLSSKYAECAAQQGSFWTFLDLLIDRQDNWESLADAHPEFNKIAREANLNSKDLQSCLQDEGVAMTIKTNKAEGDLLSVKSTPTYFVNGKMVVGSKSLGSELDALLKENGY